MKNKNKEIVFSNGDPMKPVFCLDGKKYYTDKDVERLIEEYEDRLRVARGNLNLVETLNSFMDRDLKNTRRALWLARADKAKAWFLYWYSRFVVESGFTKCDINGYVMSSNRTFRMIRDWINLWEIVARKCIKKAEEYK